MTRLLLVDDHAVVRSGLRMLLSGHSEMEIVGDTILRTYAKHDLQTLNRGTQ